jgi:midasin (ATPase involved in ribosome maturation)
VYGSVTIHDLTQERILDKDGSFIEKDMILATWLRNAQKSMSILQLDEVNAAKPETLLALHPIMDIKGELRLPYTAETLPVNKNAVLVMSCNEGDEYAGINALNMAFQNRYIKVHFSYIQGKQLAEMLHKKTSLSLDKTSMIANAWEKYMSSRQPEQPVVSIRVLERWCEMSKFLGLKQAGIYSFGTLIAENEEQLHEVIQGDFFVNLPEE